MSVLYDKLILSFSVLCVFEAHISEVPIIGQLENQYACFFCNVRLEWRIQISVWPGRTEAHLILTHRGQLVVNPPDSWSDNQQLKLVV